MHSTRDVQARRALRVQRRMPITRPAPPRSLVASARVAARRGLPSLVHAPSRRSVGAVIAMTSLIDAMLVVVFFLLGTFGQEARAAPFDRPLAKNVGELIDAPVVTVKDGAIWLDGRYVGSTDEAEATGRVRRLTELHHALAQRRATARTLTGGALAPLSASPRRGPRDSWVSQRSGRGAHLEIRWLANQFAGCPPRNSLASQPTCGMPTSVCRVGQPDRGMPTSKFVGQPTNPRPCPCPCPIGSARNLTRRARARATAAKSAKPERFFPRSFRPGPRTLSSYSYAL